MERCPRRRRAPERPSLAREWPRQAREDAGHADEGDPPLPGCGRAGKKRFLFAEEATRGALSFACAAAPRHAPGSARSGRGRWRRRRPRAVAHSAVGEDLEHRADMVTLQPTEHFFREEKGQRARLGRGGARAGCFTSHTHTYIYRYTHYIYTSPHNGPVSNARARHIYNIYFCADAARSANHPFERGSQHIDAARRPYIYI